MSEQHPTTVVGVADSLGGKLINSLPSQFIVLVAMNTMFVMGLLWYENNQVISRERIFTPILTSCLQQVPVTVVRDLMELKKQHRDD